MECRRGLRRVVILCLMSALLFNEGIPWYISNHSHFQKPGMLYTGVFKCHTNFVPSCSRAASTTHAPFLSRVHLCPCISHKTDERLRHSLPLTRRCPLTHPRRGHHNKHTPQPETTHTYVHAVHLTRYLVHETHATLNYVS